MNWIQSYCIKLGNVAEPTRGIVFEVRQGYKSKDSKRQHGDIDNAIVAWANGYLPVFTIFSAQIDADIILRYRNNRCGMLIGTLNNDVHTSIYTFCKDILGYDLATFFQIHSSKIQAEVKVILETLLRAET